MNAEKRNAILSVPCPACSSPAGKPCKRPNGSTIYPHLARRDAAHAAGAYTVR